MKREHGITNVLPSGYSPIEYIMSNNGSFIDTGFKITSNNVSVEIEYCQNGDTTVQSQYFPLFGSLASNYQSGKFGFGASQRYMHPSVGSGMNLMVGRNEFNVLDGMALNVWHKLVLSSNGNNFGANIDDGTKTYNGTQYGNIYNGVSTTIFVNRSWGNLIAQNLKVKRFKLVQNNTLVLDMIPALRISDTTPGLYDIICGIFYTNAGTGEFLYN